MKRHERDRSPSARRRSITEKLLAVISTHRGQPTDQTHLADPIGPEFTATIIETARREGYRIQRTGPVTADSTVSAVIEFLMTVVQD